MSLLLEENNKTNLMRPYTCTLWLAIWLLDSPDIVSKVFVALESPQVAKIDICGVPDDG